MRMYSIVLSTKSTSTEFIPASASFMSSAMVSGVWKTPEATSVPFR